MISDVQHLGRPAVVGHIDGQPVLFGDQLEAAGRNHRHAVRSGHAGQLGYHAGLAHHDEPRALARRSVEYETLKPVTVPSFRGPAKRIDWTLLPASFCKDVDDYLQWCGGSDPFAADARPRALSPKTLRLRRDQIHAAVTALVESDIKPASITSLAELVSPEALKRILRRRLEEEGGRENSFNRDLGEALIQIAREWVKVDVVAQAELKRLVGKMPMPVSGLTDKNKRFLRQFDDPAAMQRLFNLPGRLWAEVKREGKPNSRTLAKAQVALAVSILCYMPLRLQNLTSLTFGTHLFLREEPRAISTLELSAGEVKNRMELAYDIPLHLAKMLLEYRDRIAPNVIGHRPEQLFVNTRWYSKKSGNGCVADHDIFEEASWDRAHRTPVPPFERKTPARRRARQLRNGPAIARPQESQDDRWGLCRHR